MNAIFKEFEDSEKYEMSARCGNEISTKINTADDIENELLNSILSKYEPENRKNEVDETKEMIRELERLTLELSLTIEEKKINDYFDKQYRVYLIEQMIVSHLLSTRIKTIINLVKDDKIKVYTDNEMRSFNVTELQELFTPTKESEFIISIESSSFLNSILETYNSDKAIVNQFLCDFFRQIVSINDVVLDNIDDLFLELSASNRKTSIISNSGKPITTMMFLLLITCQSSHYPSYIYPHNAVTEIRDTITKRNEILRERDSKADYFVMNSNEFNITNIIIDRIDVRPEVGCIIDSTYKIFDTENLKKVYNIKAQTIFIEKSERCLIKYHIIRC